MARASSLKLSALNWHPCSVASEVVSSPLSGKPAIKVRDLSRDFLLAQLRAYFGETPPAAAVECGYSIWRCVETGFEFAQPAKAGSPVFYQWIGKFPFYYPPSRWEYGEVARQLSQVADGRESEFRLLDVGCGSGAFLASLEFLPLTGRHAVDFSPLAIAACDAKGFPSHCGSLASAIDAGFVAPHSLDAVTCFHCLEHVERPVDFVSELLRLLKPRGALWLSTPNSPMSFESDWFDVMNHPPHHLGRWNPVAYQRLAATLGCQYEIFSPPVSPFSLAVGAFRLVRYGAHRGVGRLRLLMDLFIHFIQLIGAWQRQSKRCEEFGRLAGDVILVKLTPSPVP
jgi:SAM-dependent methyltransferase